MAFRVPVKSSETEVQQISLQNVKLKKVSDLGPLVAKTQQCFTKESQEKFTIVSSLSIIYEQFFIYFCVEQQIF